MDVSNLQTVIIGGLGLGSAVAALFAYNQKLGKDVLREANKDYKERNEQLEADNDRLKKDILDLKKRVTTLEAEKRLPLDELTKLIIQQHSEQISSTEKLTRQIGDVAKQMGRVVTLLTKNSVVEK